MSAVTVVAKIVAKKEFIVPVKSELLELVSPTRREEGCIEYRLHQDNADPATFIFFETWQSLDCLEKHMLTAHFKTYLQAVDGMIAEKTVHTMRSIAE